MPLKWLQGIIFLLCPLSAFAHNFGVRGTTFPILEANILTVIKAHLLQLESTGYFKRVESRYQRMALMAATKPTPVPGIATTERPKSWLYNPSIVVRQSVYAPGGKRIIQAGTRYNPLAYTKLDETLLFFNASDPKQLAWAQHRNRQLHDRDKLILTGGSILVAEKSLKQRVYFDQLARLTTRFHIHAVPAEVYQTGLRLTVKEVVP